MDFEAFEKFMRDSQKVSPPGPSSLVLTQSSPSSLKRNYGVYSQSILLHRLLDPCQRHFKL
jgi:hypothetical protein